MQALTEIGNVRGYGYSPLTAYAEVTSNGATGGAQALVDNFGVKSVTRTGAGLYTIVLQDTLPNFLVHCDVVDPTNTNYHKIQVLTKNPATRTITIAHYTASTPTVGELTSGLTFNIFIYGRGSL